MSRDFWHVLKDWRLSGFLLLLLAVILMRGTSNFSLSEAAYSAVTRMGDATGYYVALQLGFFLLFFLVTVSQLLPGRKVGFLSHPAVYVVLMFLVVFLYRWPFFLEGQLNPDEDQEIASAITLLSDPVYWRSVAIGTHGPLVTYPLLLPYLFGFKLDYAAARLVGIVMMSATLGFTYLFLKNCFTDYTARVAVLPLVTFVALMSYWDFIPYNAEYPLLLLMALELFLISWGVRRGAGNDTFCWFLAGLVLGCIPFAKLQGVPAGCVMGLSVLILLFRRPDGMWKFFRTTAIFFAGVGTLPLLMYVYIRYFRLSEEFTTRYISSALNYSDNGLGPAEKIALFLDKLKVVNVESGWFFSSMIFWLVVAGTIAVVFQLKRGVSGKKNTHGKSFEGIVLSCFTALLVVSSMYSVYKPGTGFEHYYLLLVFPLGIASGLLFQYLSLSCETTRLRLCCLTTFIAVSLPLQFVANGKGLHSGKKLKELSQTFLITKYDPVAAEIKSHAESGDSMVVWGWAYQYHVMSGLGAGTRTQMDGICSEKFAKLQGYLLSSYVRELEKAKPALFVDAVAPGQFRFQDRNSYGFHLYPQIADLIRREYVLAKTVRGVDIYVARRKAAATM